MSDLLEELNEQRRRVDVSTADLTVREVVRMVSDGELNAAPVYQRKFRWTEDDESRLIESLLLGLPVPSVFVASNDDFSLEIVDGLQRVSSLVHFLAEDEDSLRVVGKSKPLKLRGLEKLSEIDGSTYAALPAEIQRYFARLPLRITTLTDKSDPEIRFQLFERLNRGALALSAQEVRTVVYRGPLIDLIRELADGEQFRKLVKLESRAEEDGTRDELVLKFFAYLDWYEDYDGRVTDFLNEYADEHKDATDIGKRRKLFRQVVDSVSEATPVPFLRKGYHSTPLNQLEAVLVAAGRLLRADKEVKSKVRGLTEDKKLKAASKAGTNTRSSFRKRIGRAEELLEG
jgi:Protein of unknown function DUF262